MRVISTSNGDEPLGGIDFNSTCHQRYEHGIPIGGLQVCPRHLRIRRNSAGCRGYQLKSGDGYILTVVNGDSGQPQFASKPMRFVYATSTEILLTGYPVQTQIPTGWVEIDLSVYGLSLMLNNGRLEKCVLHLYDRGVDLEYMTDEEQTHEPSLELTETESLVNDGMNRLTSGDTREGTFRPLYQAWLSLRRAPSQLKRIQNDARYGTGLTILLTYDRITDIDDLQQVASIGYLFISLAIRRMRGSLDLYRCRAMLTIYSEEALQYTIAPLVLTGRHQTWTFCTGKSPLEALYEMELADIHPRPSIIDTFPMKMKYNDLIHKVQTGYFEEGEDISSIISSGEALHDRLLDDLEDRVLQSGDIDF